MRAFLYSVIWATIVCLLAYAVFGIYYEEYEGAFESMFNGSFTEGIPWDNFFYMAYLGVGEVFELLTRAIPRIMWHDWVLAISLWVSVVLIFTAIWIRLGPYLKTWQIALLNVFVFVVFVLDNCLNFNLTRVSFLLCGASFMAFALLLLPQPFNRKQWPFYLLLSLLFTLGLLIRIESGILLLAIMLVYVYAHKGFSKYLFLKPLPFLIPTVIITAAVMYDIATTGQHYKLVETGAEYNMTLGNVVPVTAMRNTEDSMRYMGLLGGIVNDEVYVPYSFIKSILVPKSLWQIDTRLLSRALDVFGERLGRYWYILVLYFLLLLTAFGLLRSDKARLFRLLIYNVSFWGGLLLITYKLKMEHRVLSPLLFFFTFGLFLLLAKHIWGMLKNKAAAFCYVLIGIIALGGALWHARYLSADYKTNIAFNNQRYRQLVQAAKGKIVVPDFHVYKVMYFDNALPFKKLQAGPFKKVFQMDMSAYSLIQPYKGYLDANCKCNSGDLGAFFDYLQDNKKDFVFAGEPKRVQLFQSYLNLVHHKAYVFERQTDFYFPRRTDVRDAEDTLSLFTFR